MPQRKDERKTRTRAANFEPKSSENQDWGHFKNVEFAQQKPATNLLMSEALSGKFFEKHIPTSTVWQPTLSNPFVVASETYIPSREWLQNSETPNKSREANGVGSVRERNPKRKAVFDYSPEKHAKHENEAEVDETDGHFRVNSGAFLSSRFRIIKLLGQGTFGKVVQCTDKKYNKDCAIKIIRAIPKYREASLLEIRVLKTITKNDPKNQYACIHLRENFEYKKHICIIMDLLGCSLFDFLKSNKYIPFPHNQILDFIWQLLNSVECKSVRIFSVKLTADIHRLGLIHTDLKPENVLLIDDYYTIKSDQKILNNTVIRVIDFGSTIFADQYHASIVSTRHYRAPEIVMGIGWDVPCDLWSLGCIFMELYTGKALFQSHSNLVHLAEMEAVCGKMDPNLIKNASEETKQYFIEDELQKDGKMKNRKSIDELIPDTSIFLSNFKDLIKKLLVYDPNKRITAKEALNHPLFKSMQPKVDPFVPSNED